MNKSLLALSTVILFGLALPGIWGSGPDTDSGSGPAEWKGHTAGVVGVVFVPGGREVVSCGLDGTVRLWNAGTGEAITTLSTGNGEILALSIDAAGNSVAISRYDGKIMIISLKKGSERILSGYRGWSADVALSPDGRRAAAWSMDGDIWIFDTGSGKHETSLKGQTDKWGMALAWSPDGKYLASGRAAISIWDIASGAVVRTLEGHKNFIRDLEFSPDGRLLASAGMDKTIRVWEMTSGKENILIKPEGFAFYADSKLVTAPISLPATAVAFSPDGKTLAAAGADRVVRTWDAVSGKLKNEYKGHLGAITALAFSQDGMEILSAAMDHTIRCWRVS